MRLFGILDWLEERFRGEWDDRELGPPRPMRWASIARATLFLAMTPAVAWAFVVLARTDASPRALAVALQAGMALFSLLFDQRQEDAYQVDFGLEALDVLRDLETAILPPAGHGTADAADLPRQTIQFEGIRFAYPGSEREVFSGLDLTITAGTSLAIVGGNGAGKTTLIKLLARLHEPRSGTIRIDGTPLDDFDPEAWRRRLAVIFQDFVRYELPAADNVGFGGVELLGDERRTGDGGSPCRRPRDRPAAFPPAGPPRSTASTPGAPTSPAASGSASPWPGRCSRSRPAPASWCSTSPPPTSTYGPRPRCSTTSST